MSDSKARSSDMFFGVGGVLQYECYGHPHQDLVPGDRETPYRFNLSALQPFNRPSQPGTGCQSVQPATCLVGGGERERTLSLQRYSAWLQCMLLGHPPACPQSRTPKSSPPRLCCRNCYNPNPTSTRQASHALYRPQTRTLGRPQHRLR